MLIDLCTLAIPAFSLSLSLSLSLALSLGPFLGPGFPFPLLPKKKVRPEKDLDFFFNLSSSFFRNQTGRNCWFLETNFSTQKKLQ